MAEKFLCRACSKEVTATKNRRYRSHTTGDGSPCEMSSVEIPEDLEPTTGEDPGVPKEGEDFAQCPTCGRNVKLTRLGYFPKHTITLRGEEICDTVGVRMKNLVDLTLPGDQPLEKSLERTTRPKVSNQLEVERAKPKGVPLMLEPPPVTDAVDWSDVSAPDAPSGASTETNSPESTTTSESSARSSGGSGRSVTPSSSAEPSPAPAPAFKLGPKLSSSISQPWSPYLQPPEWIEPPLIFLQPEEYTGPEKADPLDGYALELATRIKETFYSYDNRKSSENRSAQTTLGPSEIGTPCDRRLAMALLNVSPVNPGGDGWAAFVGTCGHVGMGEMFQFADAGTGRYAVELNVETGSPSVPRGTTDLLDRRDATIVDWKFMGAYSLKKFRLDGPSPTYRVQAHVYGLAATRSGEKVKRVAIVGLPRAGGSLDEMHVWSEPFDRKLAEDALARVERIAKEVGIEGSGDMEDKMSSARTFPTVNDCRYCPFHLKTDKEMRRGCPGS
ncbi:MAG TPA: PD-(D/E)XK nuclease family protein [Acidimicrobiia bacterium]|nr:PD-(D/E)XK nuclease family protein [Acidimicrobiia bacterium]